LPRVRGLARNDPADLDTGARLAEEQGAALVLARFPADPPGLTAGSHTGPTRPPQPSADM
ncbi:hypothetical protein AB0G02_39875, partial [Actinosynnema sp. NPDC023658]|uniref:hypothetical protein n=1 Tax=Actinosynnema sp. NPDC023658 TaxID=3155465 RepID=UPI0033DCBD07